MSEPPEFSISELFAALDQQRADRGLSWTGVAKELWELSSDLNAKRNDHPISPSTIRAMVKQGDTSCQHALFMLRWIGCSPESFVSGLEHDVDLPTAGPDKRLRWNLSKIHESLEIQRRAQGLTWKALAEVLNCTPSQLTGIMTAKFAIGMKLAMRIVLWLGSPSCEFIDAVRW